MGRARGWEGAALTSTPLSPPCMPLSLDAPCGGDLVSSSSMGGCLFAMGGGGDLDVHMGEVTTEFGAHQCRYDGATACHKVHKSMTCGGWSQCVGFRELWRHQLEQVAIIPAPCILP